MTDSNPWRRRGPEPIFNVAPAVIGLAATLLGIHLIREFVLSRAADAWVLFAFAFIPPRESCLVRPLAGFPGGDAARVCSLLTYAFLHANWTHVLVNMLWLVAFGSPLAWRFGTVRFLAFLGCGRDRGRAPALRVLSGRQLPLVGASAAISAHMAGVSRFAFNGGALFAARRERRPIASPRRRSRRP